MRAFERPGSDRWEARIDLTPDGWDRLRGFRSSLTSGLVPILVFAGGEPIDLVKAGQMAFELRIGEFGFLEDLRVVFPGAVVAGERPRGESEQRSPELDAIEGRSEEDEAVRAQVDAPTDALLAGDEERAQEILDQLPPPD